MRKSLVGVVAVAALIVVGAPRARADTAELEISSGGHTDVIHLPSLGSGTFGAGFGSPAAIDLEGWSISTGFAHSSSHPSLVSLLLVTTATCSASPCNDDPLTLAISATGFTTEVHPFGIGSTVNPMSVGMTKTVEGFSDASDVLFGKTSPFPPVTLNGTGHVGAGSARGGSAGPSPYSLTMGVTFSDSSVGGHALVTSSTIAGTVVPEPGTLLLFGSGLLLVGIIVRRKELRAKAGNIGLVDVA